MSTKETITRPLRIRVNAKDSIAAEKVLKRYGLTAREGVNMFFAQVARRGTIPLSFAPYDTDDGYLPHVPNAETRAALKEVEEAIKTGKGPRYSSAREAMAALKSK